MPNQERVTIEVADHVATVTMVRSDKHNGLDYDMFQALSDAIDEVDSTRGVRAVVLRGEGRSFSAGLDFQSFMTEQRPVDELLNSRDGEIANLAQRVAYGWLGLPIPVIAAIQGNCIGGGAQIALAADIRIAAPDLKFSIREMQYGLIPDMSITTNLPRLVGIDVAKELTYTARFVDAEEALSLGLVTRVAEDPTTEAASLAAEIASRSPDAIRGVKRLYDEVWDSSHADSLALEEKIQRTLLGSPNQGAAVMSALGGEPADFADPE